MTLCPALRRELSSDTELSPWCDLWWLELNSETLESALKLGSAPSLSFISWYRRSIGAAPISDTPSWRRCRRAWLESPRRVSKYAPHTSHTSHTDS